MSQDPRPESKIKQVAIFFYFEETKDKTKKYSVLTGCNSEYFYDYSKNADTHHPTEIVKYKTIDEANDIFKKEAKKLSSERKCRVQYDLAKCIKDICLTKFRVIRVGDGLKRGIIKGTMEDGETPEEAIIRETKEELGYDLVIDKYVISHIIGGTKIYFYKLTKKTKKTIEDLIKTRHDENRGELFDIKFSEKIEKIERFEDRDGNKKEIQYSVLNEGINISSITKNSKFGKFKTSSPKKKSPKKSKSLNKFKIINPKRSERLNPSIQFNDESEYVNFMKTKEGQELLQKIAIIEDMGTIPGDITTDDHGIEGSSISHWMYYESIVRDLIQQKRYDLNCYCVVKMNNIYSDKWYYILRANDVEGTTFIRLALKEYDFNILQKKVKVIYLGDLYPGIKAKSTIPVTLDKTKKSLFIKTTRYEIYKLIGSV